MPHKDNTTMRALEGLANAFDEKSLAKRRKKKSKKPMAKVIEERTMPIEDLGKFLKKKMKERGD